MPSRNLLLNFRWSQNRARIRNRSRTDPIAVAPFLKAANGMTTDLIDMAYDIWDGINQLSVFLK